MFEFPLETGSRKYSCPACGAARKFRRYINKDNGEYLAADVGRCDRESSCGYHKPPREYFAEHPQFSTAQALSGSTRGKASQRFIKQAPQIKFAVAAHSPKKPDYIPFECFKQTLGNYDKNAFVSFLHDLFPDADEEIQAVLEMYCVGTFEDYVCFPSIDPLRRVCRAKLMRFNPVTGKRLKGEFDTSSLPAKLKLKADFQYKQIFFGEHLLSLYPDKPAAIVEAEKTAIIASLCFPEFIWLGSNSKQWLSASRLDRLGNGRKIILYPDADGFLEWQGIAAEAAGRGLAVSASSLIENHATASQRAAGYDLADYLIEQQREINSANEFVDFYNSAVDAVLSDEALLDQFETILEEQKAIAMLSGATTSAADATVCSSTNLTQIVLSLQ
jgi:transcription elongation factor Elf1